MADSGEIHRHSEFCPSSVYPVGPRGYKGVPPKGSEKQVAKKRVKAGKDHATGSKMGPKITKLAIFLVIFLNILGDYVLIIFPMALVKTKLIQFHALFGYLRVSF